MKLEKKNVKADAKPNMKFTVIDEGSIRDKIYEVRGVKVMLDFELAEIYGYPTKAFNQQVKNNIEKFDDDFRFQLTHEEVEVLSRSKILTSMQINGKKGGRSYLPYAFTESGRLNENAEAMCLNSFIEEAVRDKLAAVNA